MAESEAETPSTPGEFESKYFEFHGVRLPPFCRGKMEEIANFPVRPSDVWIVTYPKSGTSLLQEVVYLVSQGADPDEIGLMNIDEQLPVLEYPQPGLDIIKELTSPRLIKSHLPYRFLPSDLHNGDSKVIYMARNPKDLVVSYYQFHRSLRTMSYRGTFQEFCRRFMNDKLGYGSWFEHVQEFWEHRMDSNVLFLKYEDMHRDLVTMVEQLARFLGVSCDKAQLEALTEHCHQLVDQCCNAEALPVGRGTCPTPPPARHSLLQPGCFLCQLALPALPLQLSIASHGLCSVAGVCGWHGAHGVTECPASSCLPCLQANSVFIWRSVFQALWVRYFRVGPIPRWPEIKCPTEQIQGMTFQSVPKGFSVSN
uniref:Sulfotransferase n=1 Tax=Callithrix jacchus TaxID=9483 RepID=F6ZN16_CALJA